MVRTSTVGPFASTRPRSAPSVAASAVAVVGAAGVAATAVAIAEAVAVVVVAAAVAIAAAIAGKSGPRRQQRFEGRKGGEEGPFLGELLPSTPPCNLFLVAPGLQPEDEKG